MSDNNDPSSKQVINPAHDYEKTFRSPGGEKHICCRDLAQLQTGRCDSWLGVVVQLKLIHNHRTTAPPPHKRSVLPSPAAAQHTIVSETPWRREDRFGEDGLCLSHFNTDSPRRLFSPNCSRANPLYCNTRDHSNILPPGAQ